jgi:hypothetical protein
VTLPIGLLLIFWGLSGWPKFRSAARGVIELFLDPNTGGVLQIPNSAGIPTKWAQISVGAKKPLTNCEVRLLSLTRTRNGNSGELVEERVHCKWSQHSSLKINVKPNYPERINLFVLVKGHAGVITKEGLSPDKIRLHKEVQTPGRFHGRIVVFADETEPHEQTFEFEWRDFNTVTMALP